MAKTVAHRLLGLGRLPRAVRAALDAEGIRLLEEGIRVSVTYRNFRAPGKRFTRKRRVSLGAIAVSRARLVAYAGRIRLVNVALDDPAVAKIEVEALGPDCVSIAFNPADFNPGQSGRIECRFFTPQAENIVGWMGETAN